MKRRNFMMILGAAAASPAAITSAQNVSMTLPPAVPLFNGKDTTGWVNMGTKEGAWHVTDGILTVEKAGGGWLRTEKEYRNYVLRLDFRISPGGNSGVFLRAPLHGDGAYQGLEIQVLDHFHERYKDIQPAQFCGSIYGLVPSADHKALKPSGEWNHYEIVHSGDSVRVVLNGIVVADADLFKFANTINEHPGVGRKAGHIGLQSHDEKVEYKNIEIIVVDRNSMRGRPGGDGGERNQRGRRGGQQNQSGVPPVK